MKHENSNAVRDMGLLLMDAIKALNATQTRCYPQMLPKPIELEMKKSLSEHLIICWAKTADGGMVGAMKFGAEGSGSV